MRSGGILTLADFNEGYLMGLYTVSESRRSARPVNELKDVSLFGRIQHFNDRAALATLYAILWQVLGHFYDVE
jgi:hypothetical protein